MKAVLKVWQPLVHKYGSRGALIIAGVAAVTVIGGTTAGAMILGGNLSVFNSSTSVELQKGLVGHWKLDGNTNDSSAQRNQTVSSNATITTDRKNQANSAYNFDGVDDVINIADSPALSPTTGLTVNAWVKGQVQDTSYATDGNFAGIISKVQGGTGATNPAYGLHVASGRICFSTTTDADVANQECSANTLTDDTWYHVVGTYSGTTIRIYINGVQVAANSNQQPISDTTGQFRIGKQKSNVQRFFKGSVDDVRVYNRGINVNEVKALYDQYDPGLQLGSGEKGLVGHWTMDGNAKDSTPNRIHGSVSGATLTTDRKGMANSAYNFNDGAITFPSANAHTSQVFTYSAWINPSSYPGSYATILMCGSKGSQFRINPVGGVQLFNREGVSMLGNSSASSAANGGPIPINSWSHVAISYNASGNFTYYINGVATSSGTSSQVFTMTSCRIGSRSNPGVETFTGAIDDVRMYNRALSATEIAQQAQAYDSKITVGGSGKTGAVSLQKGLIGQWDFKGNANDSTPFKSNFTVNGATLTTDRKSRANYAYVFDGSSNSLSLPYIERFNTGHITLSAWVRSTRTGGGTFQTAVSRFSGTLPNTKGTWLLGYDGSNRHRFYVNNTGVSGTFQAIDTSVTPSQNVWYHLVGTYDGTSTKLYVDGQPKSTIAGGNGALEGNAHTVRVGNRADGGAHWQGSIDNVRIYNRAVSDAEVSALYNLTD